MAVVAAPEQLETVGAPVERKPKRSWKNLVLPIYTKLIIAYLLIPISEDSRVSSAGRGSTRSPGSYNNEGVILKDRGKLAQAMEAFEKALTLDPSLTSALWNSLFIAVVSTIVATVLGTMIALALVRYRFRGSGSLEVVMFLNIAAPEIVLGAALLSFFVLINFQQGLLSIFVAHVMFNIAFVAIVVRARLSGFNREIEEAAQDLYADPMQTFIKVTLPLIWPGIVAGALLAFALSIDDFVTTNFVAGQTVTFPLWVYGAVKVGIPPQVFVMGTAIFLAGVVVAIANVVSSRRKGRLGRAATEDATG